MSVSVPALSDTDYDGQEAIRHKRGSLIEADGVELAKALLRGRGFTEREIDQYMNPTITGFVEFGGGLDDMDKAVARIADAVVNREKVVFYGDYDVDGVSSCSIMLRAMRVFDDALKGPAPETSFEERYGFYIPHRMEEGYGPNAPALVGLKERGTDLVVCLDSGTVAMKPLEAAREAGLDVVVVDHHGAEHKLPPAIAIVNPNRLDTDEELRKELGGCCAAGLSFLTVILVQQELIRRQAFAGPHPRVNFLIEIAALGTVADVMPLRGWNRAIVKYGLRFMAKGVENGSNMGLGALRHVAGLNDKAPNPGHFGFQYGPRVNAAGRIGRADPGVHLLTTDDIEKALALAEELDAINKERQAIQEKVLEEALAQLPTDPDEAPSCIVVAGRGWHEGTIGICAGRIKELYNRPTIVIAIDEEKGHGKGSGRSVTGFDLGGAIRAAGPAPEGLGLLIKGGGHAMAAGLTVHPDKIDELRTYLIDLTKDLVRRHESQELILDMRGDHLVIVEPAVFAGQTYSLATREALNCMEPFGNGNPEPRARLLNAVVRKAQPTRDGKHLQIEIDSTEGRSRVMKAISFGTGPRGGNPRLGETLMGRIGLPLSLIGVIGIDTWRPEDPKLQFEVRDAIVSGT